jgi:hypothetical protein
MHNDEAQWVHFRALKNCTYHSQTMNNNKEMTEIKENFKSLEGTKNLTSLQ